MVSSLPREDRKSNFELLRIISILMITLHHLSMTYGIDNEDLFIKTCAQFFYVGGKVGVNCFVMIGSYFLVDKAFKFSRISKLYCQVLFYCFLLFLIGILFIPRTITVTGILKTILPVSFDHYWFISAYIGLLLISPFINMLLRHLDRYMHLKLIIIGLAAFTIIPTFTTQTHFISNVLWFLFLYILTAYLKKYDFAIKKAMGHKSIFIVAWLLIFLSEVCLSQLGKRIFALNEGIYFFTGMYILPQLINSLALFLVFEKMSVVSKTVNRVGEHTLSCYLVQSNYIMIPLRINLLEVIFNSCNRYLYPFVAIILAIVVLLVTTSVDCLRARLFKTTVFLTFFAAIEKKYEKITDWLKRQLR